MPSRGGSAQEDSSSDAGAAGAPAAQRLPASLAWLGPEPPQGRSEGPASPGGSDASGGRSPQRAAGGGAGAEVGAERPGRAGRAVFCDLDGVLCDFEGAVEALFGRPFPEVAKRDMWPALRRTRGFYAGLAWMPGGRELWQGLAGLRPAVLSGVPSEWGQAAAAQKRQWVRREIGAGVPVLTCRKVQKSHFCHPGDVLIDDNVNLRDDWVARGGVFVHHVSTGQSLWQLHRLGVLPARSPPGPPCRQGVQAEWAQAWWAGTWWWCRRLASLPQASSGSDAEEVEFAELPHLGYRCFVPPSSLRAPGPGPPGGRPPVREPPAAASRCGWRGAQEHRADAAAQVVVFQ